MSQHPMILGQSRAFRQLVATADSYARSPWPVLILGETGVGKELIARRLHELSGRFASRFVPINCGALPPMLFESELFGYERGAFSGAVQPSPGLLRQARGGTVFLDEVGDLDLGLQVKLLRFLDSGEIRAVGSSRLEQADVRILAATNVDLHAAVRRGSFRADLLERLSVLTLHVPPLRERREDIAALAGQVLDSLGARLEAATIECLVEYDWPGNVRQLRNLLIRASLRGKGRIRSEDVLSLLEEERRLKLTHSGAGDKENWQGSLAEIEKQVIVSRLKQCRGNRKRTAKELGIAKSTLHEKLRRWKSEGPEAPAWPLHRHDDRWDDGASLEL